MSAAKTLHLSMPEPDVALLTLDTPDKGANILSSSVLDELATALDALEQRDDLAGLVFLSAKRDIFIAGADIREFVAALDVDSAQVVQMCRRGQELFGRLASCPFVTVAAIDGICVGGGAELAIWCDHRVLSENPRTEFGFPEVKLGLFPGWGGTVRAPRIVGLSNAVEMITSGNSLKPHEALTMGLATDVVPTTDLLAAAIRIIRDEQQHTRYVTQRKNWSQPIEMSETELGFLGVTASAYVRQQTKGQYPAPEAALELMLGAAGLDAGAACQLEAEGLAKLFGTPINAALLNVFFLTDRNKKDQGVESTTAKPLPIESVGVIGAGIMGAGIGAASLKRGLSVVLSDVSRESLLAGGEQVMQEVAYNKATKGTDAKRAIEFAPLLNLAEQATEAGDCDLVIEAIVESPDIKKQLYAQLEPLLGEQTILASNTSTLPITSLSADLQRPDRFCGIHFFNPVRQMRLVEVIRGEQSSDETIASAVAYAKRIGKMPIVVNDGPGFVVNRLLLPYMNEAVALLSEGVPLPDLERAGRTFGFPMGPFTLFDVVGLDTAAACGRTMYEAFPERVEVSPIVPALVKRGRLGQKSGAGFYAYKNRKAKGQPDPKADEIIEPFIRKKRDFTQEEITQRIMLPTLVEATRVLQDNIARNARDIDLGMIFALGFPAFRGGLLFWADTLGAAQIVEMLKPLEALGKRMEPTDLLLEMAKDHRKFYDL